MDEILQSPAGTLTIIANGQPHTVKAGSTVSHFLQDLGIAPARVVVQLDGVIIPRENFVRAALRQGSRLEIVTLVGGG